MHTLLFTHSTQYVPHYNNISMKISTLYKVVDKHNSLTVPAM